MYSKKEERRGRDRKKKKEMIEGVSKWGWAEEDLGPVMQLAHPAFEKLMGGERNTWVQVVPLADSTRVKAVKLGRGMFAKVNKPMRVRTV